MNLIPTRFVALVWSSLILLAEPVNAATVTANFSAATGTAGAARITYGAEWSATMQPGSWKDIPDTGNGNEHIFRVPASTSPNLFLRLKVTGW